jgi:hypothetical protein
MVMLPFLSPALREKRAGHMIWHRLYAILETQRPGTIGDVFFLQGVCIF